MRGSGGVGAASAGLQTRPSSQEIATAGLA
jgi:hypothetical protein